MRKLLFIPLSFSILLVLGGCTHQMRHFFTGTLKPRAFSEICVGMSKNAILVRIGEPDIVRGAKRNEYNEVIEVWEYKVAVDRKYLIDTNDIIEKVEPYYLYFKNGRLSHWGKSGDWERRPDYISEVRYR